MVYKIENGRVTNKITTGRAPFGICANKDGAIYVCNYLDSTVVKLVNDTIVATIKTGLYPRAICCDRNSDVFVACQIAGTVVKLVKDVRAANIPVGMQPYSICCAHNGSIYVANMRSNTVSKIDGIQVTKTINVGDKPVFVGSTDTNVYVFCQGDNEVYKLTGDVASKILDLDFAPTAFGDFTGYQAYLMYKYTGSGTGLQGKVSFDDLNDDLKAMIQNGSGISLPIDDADVDHDHPTYDTVKKALDYLLYVQPKINSFTNSVNKVEKGSTVTDVHFTWSFNKTMNMASLSTVGDVTGQTSYDITGASITTDTSYTLTAKDEKNATVTATTFIKFLDKVYYGVADDETQLGNAEILALTGNLAEKKNTTATLDCTGGKYIVFAFPKTMNVSVNDFVVGGFANSDWQKYTVQFTNASGYQSDYDVFRSTYKQNGNAISVVVK